MHKATVISNTQKFVEETFSTETSAHDYWHIYRVWQLAKRIAAAETDIDMFTLELAALLHDIADYKTINSNEESALQIGRKWLSSQGVDTERIGKIVDIVRSIGFRGGKGAPITIREAQIISDADRLDAMGAIGIARTFAYGGKTGSAIHNPNTRPTQYDDVEAYKQAKPTTINHFHEKLFLLKDLMYTQTGKKIAEHRHAYMKRFITEFHDEWEGKL